MSLKLLSWNVNGIRAILKKNFSTFFNEEKPDFLCIQETKAQPEQVELKLEGYKIFWNSAKRKGYSGTAIFTKHEPLSVSNGIGIEKHDNEGRVITLEYKKAFLVTVYTPNSQSELRRLSYRTKEWDKDFLDYVKKLEEKKPVIICGDLNVAHQEIDLANPKQNTKNPGFTKEERKSFDNIVESGFIDSFRYFNKEPHHYTWWSYRTNARARNSGWRIDYFCVSKSLISEVKSASILSSVMGSDHCPVSLELDKHALF